MRTTSATKDSSGVMAPYQAWIESRRTMASRAYSSTSTSLRLVRGGSRSWTGGGWASRDCRGHSLRRMRACVARSERGSGRRPSRGLGASSTVMAVGRVVEPRRLP